MHILIIDDDIELCDLLREFLEQENFTVATCHDGNEGLALAASGDHDFLILDVMLPGYNGFDLLKQLRRFSTIPVLMLTARGDAVDRIVGLELGPTTICLSLLILVNWWLESGLFSDAAYRMRMCPNLSPTN